ncbi:MAG: MFS transporter [Leucobacter sp.]
MTTLPAATPSGDRQPYGDRRQGRRRHWALLFVAVCLAATNLRMTITGVGPLLDDIAADQGVSPAVLGLLASIPMVVWGLVSPLAQGFAARIGLDPAVAWSLVVLIAGTVWRSLPGSPLNLWLGTALIGVALAIANVLLPATIKRDFGSRVPLVMGLYSTLLSGTAAIGAGIVAPIAHAELPSGEPLGWRIALLATGTMALPALIVWLWASRRRRADPAPAAGVDAASSRTPASAGASDGTAPAARSAAPARPARLGLRIWRDPVAWAIALYMGTQSSTFYIWATWLSPIDLSRGQDPITAGFNVMVYHVCGMIGSLVAPFISRGAMRRILPVLLPIGAGIGAAGLILVPSALPLWLVVCGLTSGCALSITLTFMVTRASDAASAAATAGMSQSVGYGLSALGPILFGWLHGISGEWGLPLVVLLVGIFVQLLAGISLSRERMVFGPRV